MVVKLIQSLLTGKKIELIDSANQAERIPQKSDASETLNNVHNDHIDFDGIIKHGWTNVKRRKMRESLRKSVWGIVSKSLGFADEDMVEEITERIAEAAEFDPYYKKLFDKDGDSESK